MKRDPRAFLSDVIEAGQAILQAVDGINLDDYCSSRLIRSSVEREFITIGEALTHLSQRDQAPLLAASGTIHVDKLLADLS